MVRTNEPGELNLSVGEPYFLAEHLSFAQAVCPEGPFLYPETRGEPELLRELERRHHGMHVVVTVGAKQAISAALAAYAEVYGKQRAELDVPFWPSYTFLAGKELSGGLNPPLGAAGDPAVEVRINTSPNNPDGLESGEDCDIWDAAYGSPVYGFTVPPAHWTVAIYSAAKMFGLSGLRVGWAATADARLAKAMTTYVERYTSGVCVVAQRHVASVLAHVRRHDDHRYFDEARKTLLANGEIFKRLLGDSVQEYHGVPASGKGMFAWFRLDSASQESFREAMKTSRVKLVTGEACGMPEGTCWWRMSMGHHTVVTTAALEALSRAWISP